MLNNWGNDIAMDLFYVIYDNVVCYTSATSQYQLLFADKTFNYGDIILCCGIYRSVP